MEESIEHKTLTSLLNNIKEYKKIVRKEFSERMKLSSVNVEEDEKRAVVGGLLARQVSLATEFCKCSSIWTLHIAPIIQRCMIDVHITLAWILEDPEKRCKEYIEYGLGQVKLMIEHRKLQLKSDGVEADDDPVLNAYEDWLNNQKHEAFVEVNLGRWSNKSVRKMAEESDNLDIYNYIYTPFSGCVHSMWNHIERLNLTRSTNPLHKGLPIPVASKLPVSMEELFLVAKYLHKTFLLYDEKTGCNVPAPSAYDFLNKAIDKTASDLKKYNK